MARSGRIGEDQVRSRTSQERRENIMSEVAVPSRRPVAAFVAAGAVVLLLGGTVLLWAHLGTAVFFEMMRAGFVACFG
jgi:hypothetical protein